MALSIVFLFFFCSRQTTQPTNTQASPPRPSTLLISEPKPVPTSARKLARASSPTKVNWTTRKTTYRRLLTMSNFLTYSTRIPFLDLNQSAWSDQNIAIVTQMKSVQYRRQPFNLQLEHHQADGDDQPLADRFPKHHRLHVYGKLVQHRIILHCVDQTLVHRYCPVR